MDLYWFDCYRRDCSSCIQKYLSCYIGCAQILIIKERQFRHFFTKLASKVQQTNIFCNCTNNITYIGFPSDELNGTAQPAPS